MSENDGTVYGIRPHRPLTQEQHDRQRALYESMLPLRPADLFRLRMELEDRTGLPRSSGNFEAVLAAVEARGPRCETCDGWTFRPVYFRLPRTLIRQCPECRPSRWPEDGPAPEEYLAIELSYGPRRMT